VCIADDTIGLLLMCADITIGLLLTFTCRCHYRSPVEKLTLLLSLRLDDAPNDTRWQYCHVVPFSLLSTNVGKEMPISRIVVGVPNATVVLLD
jgi:hypothetical protein